MKSWSGTNSFLFLIAIFTFITPIYPYKTVSYNETEPGYQIYQILTYRDGTSVAYLTKPINKTCNEPRIDLRIINSDGSIDAAEVNYSIPDFNFCLKPNDTSLHIALFDNAPNNIIILYENSTDVNSASYYALLVSRTGEFISNTFLSRVSAINGSLSSSGDILPHFNENHGFLFWSFLSETTLHWIYFSKPDSEGNFEQLNDNRIELSSPLDSFNVFSAIDGAFGLVTSNFTNFSNQSRGDLIDPTEPTFGLYVTFIKPGENAVDGPFLLYQTEIPNLQVVFQCNSAYATMGYFCILTIKKENPNKKPNYYLIKITFQDIGSVNNVEKFSDLESRKYLTETTKFYGLYNGGFLVLFFNNSEDNLYKTIQATILDNNGDYNSTLDLPKNLKAPNHITMPGSRSNTFLVPQQENLYTWKIYSEEYPKFIYNDNGYDNPHIQSTYPSINSNIPLSTTNINITYQLPITMSTSNISVYQYNDENPILRLSVPGSSSFFSRSADNQTLILSVLESTFNQPNSTYYIVINDNTVRDWKTNQPLLGIESNIWKFITAFEQNTFAEPATGEFSLTTEGTKYYESLSPHNKTVFLSQLRFELSESIPIDIDRLDEIKCCKYDKSQQSSKIILSLSIKSTEDLNERNVDQIIRDLNILIKEKEITPISWFSTTNLLDDNFGFQKTRNFFDHFKFHLIGISIGIIILGLFYLYARKRHSKGKNIVIFKLALIVVDFVLDILFILNNGRNVPVLFSPSIIFCVIPTVINSIMSMTILLREITQNESFYKWFQLNTSIAALFTILAGADLEILNTLSSQVAGIMLFDAPMSKKAQSFIFWGGFVGLFIEDVPQLVIQVIYQNSIVNYDIIPFLTLLTSSIVLTNNIICRIYHAIVYLRKNRRMSPTDLKILHTDIEKGCDSLAVPQISKKLHRHSM